MGAWKSADALPDSVKRNRWRTDMAFVTEAHDESLAVILDPCHGPRVVYPEAIELAAVGQLALGGNTSWLARSLAIYAR
jgi:hypothetical protein